MDCKQLHTFLNLQKIYITWWIPTSHKYIYLNCKCKCTKILQSYVSNVKFLIKFIVSSLFHEMGISYSKLQFSPFFTLLLTIKCIFHFCFIKWKTLKNREIWTEDIMAFSLNQKPIWTDLETLMKQKYL